MEWYHIYLFTRVDSLICFMGLGIGFGACVVLLHILFSYIWNESETIEKSREVREKMQKRNKKVMLSWILLIILFIAMPNQKELAAIYLIPKLAKSEFASEASKLPTEVTKLLRFKMESWINDLGPNKNKITNENKEK